MKPTSWGWKPEWRLAFNRASSLQYRASPTCGLCNLFEIKSGKDKLLYIDSYCYIVRNGNTHLIKSDVIQFARLRLSLTLHRHSSEICRDEEEYARSFFSCFISSCMKASEGKDFLFEITMGTYPEHWHIHAYFPPWSITSKTRMVSGVIFDNEESPFVGTKALDFGRIT